MVISLAIHLFSDFIHIQLCIVFSEDPSCLFLEVLLAFFDPNSIQFANIMLCLGISPSSCLIDCTQCALFKSNHKCKCSIRFSSLSVQEDIPPVHCLCAFISHSISRSFSYLYYSPTFQICQTSDLT